MHEPDLSELVNHQNELEALCLARFKRGEAVLMKLDLPTIMTRLYCDRPNNVTGADLFAAFIEKLDEVVPGLTREELADFFIMLQMMRFAEGVKIMNEFGL